MERWHNRVAVVTGASSGIGISVVIDLIKANVKVVGLARRVHKVEEIRSKLPENLRKNFFAKKCDVSNESEVIKVFDAVVKELGSVDILINNAGIMHSGFLTTMDSAPLLDTVHVNVMGIIHCTKQAFKSMKARNFNGHVVLINSIAGHRITSPCADAPSINVYSPTKYAVTAMTEVYRQEFSDLGTKCKITSISPGLTDTEMLPPEWRDREDINYIKAEDVAGCVMFALSTHPNVQISEITVLPVGRHV